MLDDRGRVQWLRRAPGPPRRHAFGGVAGASREAAGVQAADEVDISLGVRGRRRIQLRFQRLVHRAATARRHRIQLPARGRLAATQQRGGRDPDDGGPCRRQRGHDWNRRGHVHAREAGDECVRPRGRRRLPHVFHLCARAGCPLGHVPVARPCPQRAQRNGRLVASPRRVRQQVMGGSIAMTSTRTAAATALTATLGLAAASWVVAVWHMNGMDMAVATPLGSFASFVAMWVPMMAAMMLPGAAPAVLRRARTSARVRDVLLFVGSYLAVWTLVGVAVYALYRPHG